MPLHLLRQAVQAPPGQTTPAPCEPEGLSLTFNEMKSDPEKISFPGLTALPGMDLALVTAPRPAKWVNAHPLTTDPARLDLPLP
jgi:hypothetical protein